MNTTKYVSKDGFSEFVYDDTGDLVADELDMGTYNFFSPIDNESDHYFYDIIPYYEWGYGPKYNGQIFTFLIKILGLI